MVPEESLSHPYYPLLSSEKTSRTPSTIVSGRSRVPTPEQKEPTPDRNEVYHPNTVHPVFVYYVNSAQRPSLTTVSTREENRGLRRLLPTEEPLGEPPESD